MQQTSPMPGDGLETRPATPSPASGADEQRVPGESEAGHAAPQAEGLDHGRPLAEQPAPEPLVQRSSSAVVLIMEARRLLELACSMRVSAPPFREQITVIRLLI